MTTRAAYSPGPATGAQIKRNEGDSWTLILVRTLRHAPEKVWQALTDPDQLREWAPFDADHNLGTVGATATLTTIGAPAEYASQTKVTRADKPRLLEYQWGGGDMRWELEASGSGTQLTLWANIDRRYIAMGAAGWHLCLDVMDHLLGDTPIGRIVGPDAMKFEGWQRLYAEYSKEFGVESPNSCRRFEVMMSPASDSLNAAPRWMTWAGRILSFLVVAQLLSSAFFRGTQHGYAVTEIVTGYGYPESAISLIVISECTLVALYLIPQTSVLAAILLTGYLGGAVAAHLRVGDTARAAIPLVVGILAWGGLYWRDARIRALIPFRRSA